MKNKVLLLQFYLFIHLSTIAQVKIGYNVPAVPAATGAWLELSNNSAATSTNWRGLLLPRVDFSNSGIFPTNATWGISGSPLAGLIVYNAGNRTTNGFSGPGVYCWNAGQWVWLKQQPVNSDWGITGNSGTNTGTDFLGTTDNTDLAIRTNNQERMRIARNGNVGIGHNNPVANVHLYGEGSSGFSPGIGGGGPELAFSHGLLLKPGSSIQMIDYDGYSAGLCFNVHRGTANGAGGSANNDWPNDVIQALTIENTGNVGIGTTDPDLRLQINGGLAVEPVTVSVTADNQLITVGDRTFLLLSSNSATANSRTLNLSNGLLVGQLLFLQCSAGAVEVQDNDAVSNSNLGATRALGVNDQLHLIWNGTSWLEVAFANN